MTLRSRKKKIQYTHSPTPPPKKCLQAYIPGSRGKQHGKCEVKSMNPKLGQDVGRKKLINQRPWSNSQETTVTHL